MFITLLMISGAKFQHVAVGFAGTASSMILKNRQILHC